MALFLGDNSPVCVNASNVTGIRRNCVYFTQVHFFCDVHRVVDYAPLTQDMGIYDIETGNIESHFSIDASILSRMKSQRSIWVVPTRVLK